jgi:hypothetical protein
MWHIWLREKSNQAKRKILQRVKIKYTALWGINRQMYQNASTEYIHMKALDELYTKSQG